MPAQGLKGRVAFVTGAGGEHGFGRAIACRLAEDGADVVVTDLGRREVQVVPAKPRGTWRGLDDVVAEIEKLGRRALAVNFDVRDPTGVTAAMARAVEAFGRLDILVNNAAAPPGPDRVPVIDLDHAAWGTVLDTNLKGTYLCAQAAATVMLRQKRIGRIAYCASKFGIIGFTQALAKELAPAGITVNAICPGAADTERIDYMGRRPDGGFDPGLRAAGAAQYAATIPLGRLATAQDVAELAAFLASDGAAYITGQAINLAGGLTAH
jgi:NAD(P)-dependent dehydrogenase (short-subunit alcohol dehydrogenase family)